MGETPLRYWQASLVSWDRTKETTLIVDTPEGPDPIRVWDRVAFTPDMGEYLCSSTRMVAMTLIGRDVEFDSDVSDEHREQWNDYFNEEAEDETFYVEWASLVRAYEKDGTVLFAPMYEKAVYQGEFTDSNEAIDYAFANHLV